MSLRYEQYQSLKSVKELLHQILYKTMPRSEMKKKIIQALRHYPPLTEAGEPIFSQDEFTADEFFESIIKPWTGKVKTVKLKKQKKNE